MAIAAPEDVAVAIGRPISSLSETEHAQIEYWLDAAELTIVARLGVVSALDAAAVRYVETEAVAAKLTNPSGFQSETIDDYTYRYGSETRRVTILDEWWRLLDPQTGSGAFSARPYFEPDTSPIDSLDWS